MTEQPYRLAFIALFYVVLYPVVVGSIYAWLRTVRDPLNLFQLRMFRFVAIWFAGVCLLGIAFVASSMWLIPLKESAVFSILLGIVWAWASARIATQMSPRGEEVE
jgi:hypothetical protein